MKAMEKLDYFNLLFGLTLSIVFYYNTVQTQQNKRDLKIITDSLGVNIRELADTQEQLFKAEKKRDKEIREAKANINIILYQVKRELRKWKHLVKLEKAKKKRSKKRKRRRKSK